jgi:hypothetical protein
VLPSFRIWAILIFTGRMPPVILTACIRRRKNFERWLHCADVFPMRLAPDDHTHQNQEPEQSQVSHKGASTLPEKLRDFDPVISLGRWMPPACRKNTEMNVGRFRIRTCSFILRKILQMEKHWHAIR